MEDNIYVTTDGAQVRLRPVSMFLLEKVKNAVVEEFRARGARLDPPTYTAVTVTGEKEVHPHTESTLETDEDRAAWAEYTEATASLEREQKWRILRALLRRGVVLKGVPEEWIEDQRYEGITLPEDPRDLALEYIQTELLKTPADLMMCMGRIQALSMRGMDKEEIEKTEALFRSPVERDTVTKSADGRAE